MNNMGIGEANPILAYLVAATGTTWSILWFKATVYGLFIIIPYISWDIYRKTCQTKAWIFWAFGALNLMYLVVVIKTLYIITTHQWA